MTDFLTIHGVPVPVAAGRWKRTPVRVGDRRARGVAASLRPGETRIVDRWQGSTPLLDPTEIVAFEGLLQGWGHSFSFERDVWSSRGGVWSATLPTRQSVNKKFGTYAGEVASAASVVFAPGYDTFDQTLLIWRRPGAGAFDHYGLTRTAGGTLAEVKNGVVIAYGVAPWCTFAAASITLLGKNDAGTNTIVQYDDIVVLPFLLTPAQIQAVYAAGAAWGDLPFIVANGEGVGGAPVDVLGEVSDVSSVAMHSPLTGVWTTTCGVVDFTIEEK